MVKKRGKSQSGPASAASGGPSNSGGGMAMGGYVGGGPVKARAASAVEAAGDKQNAKATAARAGATAGRRTAAKAAGYKEGMESAKGYQKGGLVKRGKHKRDALSATIQKTYSEDKKRAKSRRKMNESHPSGDTGSKREGYSKRK